MRAFQPSGAYQDIIEAPSPLDKGTRVKLGLRFETARRLLHRRQRTALAQYFGLVQVGMCDCAHLFRGIKRPLKRADDMNGDKHALAFSWRPALDYLLMGPEEGWLAIPRFPPNGEVFVVVVVPELKPTGDGIFGTVENWSWVRESMELPQAPVNSTERYDQKLWSKTE